MTKDDIVTRICQKHRTSNYDAINVVDATFDIIKSSLERGEKVKRLIA